MSEEKHRHGCLTALLWVMIVLNALTAVFYLAANYLMDSSDFQDQFAGAPTWTFPALIVLGVVNVVCAIALLRWQKWGFWGFIVSAMLAVVVNLQMGLQPMQAFLGLVGVGILYGVLQISDGKNTGWSQLE